MRPNVFNFRREACPEDVFSESLAYVVNLFKPVGQRLVGRIATLAGKSSSYFGDFKGAEFIAHEYQQDHLDSRPDVLLRCNRRAIFVETKLNSPLNYTQMERHAHFTHKSSGANLIFVSNILHSAPTLCA